MKEKLSRIRSPWRRLMIGLLISILLKFDQIRSRSPRRKMHWVGSHARPRRLERALFIALLFAAMVALEPHQYMLWAVLWGSGASIFVIVRTLFILAQRKIYPSNKWINPELQ